MMLSPHRWPRWPWWLGVVLAHGWALYGLEEMLGQDRPVIAPNAERPRLAPNPRSLPVVLSLRLNTPPVATVAVPPSASHSSAPPAAASPTMPSSPKAPAALLASTPQRVESAKPPAKVTAAPPPTTPLPSLSTTPSLGMLTSTPLRVPAAVTLHYAVSGQRQGVTWQGGTGQLQWTHDGSRYAIAWYAPHRSGKTRTQTSIGQLSAHRGLLPIRFGDRLRSELAVHFQRAPSADSSSPADEPDSIRFSANRPTVALQDGGQDQLSTLLQLAAVVAGRVALGLPMQTELRFQVATARDAAVWTFHTTWVVHDSDTGAPPTDDVYVKKQPSHPYDGTWEWWLSAESGYLPSRWRITLHNGDFDEYTLTR